MAYFKKIIISTFLAAIMLPGVFAQSTTIEEARNSGYGIGGSAFGSEYELDENGNIVKDSNGNPVKKKRESSLENSLKILNGTAGASGVNLKNNPGKNYSGGVSTGGAEFDVNSGTDFRCDSQLSDKNFKVVAVAGVRFKITSCDLNTSTGDGPIMVATCYKGLSSAHTCPAASDYDTPFKVVSNGSFTSDGKQLSVGIGCNDKQLCRLTAKGKITVKASSADMDTSQSRQSDLREGLATSVSQGDLAGQSREYGQTYRDCMQKNLDNGTMATCDGSYSVGIDTTTATGDAANCTAERKCTQEAVETETTRKVCFREFEISNHLKQVKYPTKSCELTHKLDLLNWANGYENSADSPEYIWWQRYMCSINTYWCNQGGWWGWHDDSPNWQIQVEPDDDELSNSCGLNNALKISGSGGSWVCTKRNPWWGGWQDGSGNECIEVTYTRNAQFYDINNPVVALDTLDPPIESGGVCNATVEKNSEYFSCTGSWVARTLSTDQCTVNFYDEYTGSNVTGEYDEFKKAGCGYCTEKSYKSVCSTGRSNSTCTSAELQNCTLTEKTPKGYSGGDTGVIESQEEVYTCTTQKTVCVAWSHATGSSYCISNDLAHGLDKKPASQNTSDDSWGKVAAASDMFDQVASGAKNAQTPEIKLFTGNGSVCSSPIGIGAIGQKNCCKTSLTRPSSNVLTQQGCSEDEAKLAAARRKGTTHYVGQWKDCNWLGICHERHESYCVFESVLARVVQEQGRKQLEEIVAGATSNKETATLSFNYYSATNTGNWNTQVSPHGIKTTAWSWPAFCSDDAEASRRLLNDPTGPQCGGALSVWLATCTKDSCGDLPTSPGYQDSGWDLVKVDPLSNSLNATSRYSTVKGACDTSTSKCTYTVTAVPPSSGGMAMAQQNLSWQLFANMGEDAAPQTMDLATYQTACRQKFGNVPQCDSIPDSYKASGTTVGDIIIKPGTLTGYIGASIPSTVPVAISANSGSSYSTVNVVPDGVARDYSVTVAGKSGNTTRSISLQITCSKMTGMCTGKASVQIQITTMPWGGAKSPNCDGFTIVQFGVLNFDKMDLTEWTNSLDIKGTPTQDKQTATQTAMDQVSSFNAAFNGGAGSVSSNVAKSDNFVNVSKTSGYGPFTVTVSMPAVYPYASATGSDRDLVNNVSIDWGDCSAKVTNSSTQTNGAFSYSHSYGDPKAAYQACGKGGLEEDFIANLTVTVNLRNKGNKTYTFKITNYWGTVPTSNKGATSQESSPVTVPAKDPRLPVVEDPNKPPSGG